MQQTSQYTSRILELIEASPQWSAINGACGVGPSTAVGIRLLRSWHHNTLQLKNGAEHWQNILILIGFNDVPLLQIYVNKN